jgi:hypothetical protein
MIHALIIIFGILNRLEYSGFWFPGLEIFIGQPMENFFKESLYK